MIFFSFLFFHHLVSALQFSCGAADLFCPIGSGVPQSVQIGYFTVAGGTHRPYDYGPVIGSIKDGYNVVQQWDGLVGTDGNLFFASGQDSGFGDGGINVNQASVADPTTRGAERHCPPGSYCTNGTRTLCPAGFWGGTFGLDTPHCSGACAAGFYCPDGSSGPYEVRCGDADRYCPEGSAFPLFVLTGYFSTSSPPPSSQINSTYNTTSTNEQLNEPPSSFYSTGVLSSSSTRSAQTIAPSGHYATGGLLYECRAGYFGSQAGLSSPLCSGPCSIPGYYCPTGSTHPMMRVCGGDSVYCPPLSVAPVLVHNGFYTADYLYDACPPGKWRNWKDLSKDSSLPGSQRGAASMMFVPDCQLCPDGTFKSSTGDAKSLCQSCSYSVNGVSFNNSISTPSRMVCECIEILAPFTAPFPAYAQNMMSSVNKSSTWKKPFSGSIPSQSVFFDLVSGRCVTMTDSVLMAMVQSFSDAAAQLGLSFSATTMAGNVGSSGTANANANANANAAVLNVMNDELWATNSSLTRYIEFLAEPGHYAAPGTGIRRKCTAGYYGALRGETRRTCQGKCAQGYFCQQASISPFASPCGSASLICAEGSALPVVVPAGYYSNEDSQTTLRYQMFICPPGWYCVGDGFRSRCPSGSYAAQPGSMTSLCAGVCDRGYYCTSGSSSPQQHRCGSSAVYCPRGSSVPSPVTNGFYSAFTGPDAGAQALWDPANSTTSVEVPCEPGYFCVQGVKYPCPPGTFGWRYGMNSSACGGLCAPGYYCPSYLDPRVHPEAPPHTGWPLAPHTHAATAGLDCGAVMWVCPAGSFFPAPVGGGNYTYGGSAGKCGAELASSTFDQALSMIQPASPTSMPTLSDLSLFTLKSADISQDAPALCNATRSSQAQCPTGTYCEGGVPFLCPRGKYGSTLGLADPTCSAWCPVAHYCPVGTAFPIPCAFNAYSTGGSWTCSVCPGTRSAPLQCHDARSCCFRDGP